MESMHMVNYRAAMKRSELGWLVSIMRGGV